MNTLYFREQFITAAIDHESDTIKGDSRKTNRAADKLAAIYVELKQDVGKLIEILLELLNYPNESVQKWAAGYLLPYRQEIAEQKLEEIANGDGYGFTTFDALMVLKEWRKGTLKFPPFDS